MRVASFRAPASIASEESWRAKYSVGRRERRLNSFSTSMQFIDSVYERGKPFREESIPLSGFPVTIIPKYYNLLINLMFLLRGEVFFHFFFFFYFKSVKTK